MVYVFLAKGFEEIEALAQIDILRRAGLGVTTVSITNKKQVCGAHGVTVLADELFDTIDFSDATALILPGGMPGATNLASHSGLCEVLIEKQRNNCIIAAICAAPLVFGRLGLLNGKRATIYPGMEAEISNAVVTHAMVEKDGKIITGKGPAAAIPFAYAIVDALLGRGSSAAIAKGMLYE